MDQKQIGYFYFYKRCLLGEIHSPDTTSGYDGHYKFWTTEAPKVFCTPDIQTVLMASYGCDRGRITYQNKRYIFLGTPGIIKNRDIMRLIKLNFSGLIFILVFIFPGTSAQPELKRNNLFDFNWKFKRFFFYKKK